MIASWFFGCVCFFKEFVLFTIPQDLILGPIHFLIILRYKIFLRKLSVRWILRNLNEGKIRQQYHLATFAPDVWLKNQTGYEVVCHLYSGRSGKEMRCVGMCGYKSQSKTEPISLFNHSGGNSSHFISFYSEIRCVAFLTCVWFPIQHPSVLCILLLNLFWVASACSSSSWTMNNMTTAKSRVKGQFQVVIIWV